MDRHPPHEESMYENAAKDFQERQIQERIQTAVKQEREACAAVADQYADTIAQTIAAAIRARGDG